MSKNNFQYGGWNSYTLQCGTIMTSISPETAPCNVALESWEWIHQVAAPCNVIRGSGWHATEFARWQHPAMWHVALESWQWIHQVAAPCNVIRGSGMTCHWIRPNVCYIGILHLHGFDFDHIIAVDMTHSAPVSDILSKSDLHPRQKKITWKSRFFCILASTSKMADLCHLGF